MRAFIRIAALFVFLIIISAATAVVVHSQSNEPTAIIDAAYKDLSQRLGQVVTRQTLNGFDWTQQKFPDSSLGCPQPGQTYAQVITPGFRILIDVNGNIYDYRATLDGNTLFLCSLTAASTGSTPASGPGVNMTAAPTVPPAGNAQGTAYQNPIAYVGADGNVTINAAGAPAGTLITNDAAGARTNTPPFFNAGHSYGQFRWSPDGTKLLFTDPQTSTLFEVNSGSKPTPIARGIATIYPGAWSLDGSQIAYVVEQPTGAAQIQILPTTGGQATTAVTFTEQTGCGGGTPDPADALFQSEAGYEGNNQVLAYMPNGFLVTTACFGGQLELIGMDSKVIWQQPDIVRTAVSPDHTRAVGIDQKQRTLNLISLTDGKVTPVTVQAGIADQVAWSADGNSLLYSTLEANPPVKGTDNSPVGSQLFGGSWPLSAQGYNVTLWQQPINGGAAVKLFSREGRGIGVIASMASGSGVIFSFVGSSVAMVQQINAGKSAAEVIAAAPRIEVLSMATQPVGSANRITFGGQPAANKGTFIAVPAANASVVVPTTNAAAPTSVACTTRPAGWVSYVVQTGDTLSSIATRTGSTVADLAAVNCLQNADNIQVGQTLAVPRTPAPVTPAPISTASG